MSSIGRGASNLRGRRPNPKKETRAAAEQRLYSARRELRKSWLEYRTAKREASKHGVDIGPDPDDCISPNQIKIKRRGDCIHFYINEDHLEHGHFVFHIPEDKVTYGRDVGEPRGPENYR